MGSRKKTYRNFNSARMFKDEDNLYIQEIIRIYAQTKSMSPEHLLPPVLNDSQTFFKEKVFEKMGKTVDINFEQGVISDDAILNEVQNCDSSATVVNEWFISDDNDVEVDGLLIKVKEFLSSTPVSNDCSGVVGYQDFIVDGNAVRIEIEYPTYLIDGVKYHLSLTNGVPTIREFDNDIIITLIPLLDDCTVDPDTDVIEYKLPQDTRAVIATVYNTTKSCYIFEDQVMLVAENYTGFMLVMRKDFNNVDPEESKESKFMFSRFGLNAEDEDGNTLQDQLNQDDLKDAFLTYASSREDNMFGKYVDILYGGTGTRPGNRVEVTGELNLVYENASGFSGTGYQINYSGGSFPTDYTDDETGDIENRYMIPFQVIDELILKDKYQAYNKLFCMFAYSEKTVKLKWYQTGIFRFIMMVVGIAFAIMTGVNIGMLLLGQVVTQVLQAIDPRIAAILGVVVGFITGQFSGSIQGITNLANNILKVVMTFHTVAFQNSMEAIKNTMKELADDIAEMTEEIDETLNNTIFIPFGDKVEYLYNGNYDAAVNTPELVYNTVDMDKYTNYDKYFNMF